MNFAITLFFTYFTLSSSLLITGNRSESKPFENSVGTFCDFFQQIELLLTKAEQSRDVTRIAWTYGYLSAIFSVENDHLKRIIQSYSNGQMGNEHSRSIFNCLEGFTQQLSLNKYISDHGTLRTDLKKEYLIATEDIRSIMESGIAFSFYMYSEKEPEKLLKRFLQIYKNRDGLSEPINRFFNILAPRNISRDQTFLYEVLTSSQCDTTVRHFAEVIVFFNTVQRYLISSLFAEDLYFILNHAELNETSTLGKYKDKLTLHRQKYRDISYGFVENLKKCQNSLNKLQQQRSYRLAYSGNSCSSSIWNGSFSTGLSIILLWIIGRIL